MRPVTRNTWSGRSAGSARSTWLGRNARGARGAAELSVAFDWPSRMGIDSDSPRARGLVGIGGTAVDSIDDMRILFGGVPLRGVSTRLTIDTPGVALLLLYHLVQEEQGRAIRRCSVLLRSAGRAGADEDRLIARVVRFGAAEGIRISLATPGSVPAPESWPLDLPAAPEPPSPAALRQAERLAKLRAWRCHERVDAALGLLRGAAEADGAGLPAMRAALATGATIGEVSTVLRAARAAAARTAHRSGGRAGPPP
ncbi:methylmalonyl-CoA mutase family protein [Streptomyces sp. NPDC090025]|uniref:methylmalonyl-CoA mutase family protein n=1 Tax=Streptomyces sp. NPDC090025 TaxID=3365922 RepID=UPI00383564C8